MPTGPWPDLRPEDRRLVAAMEERLQTSDQSPGEMWTRAGGLREQAEQSDVSGHATARRQRYCLARQAFTRHRGNGVTAPDHEQ
jgi:hypothetical protein